MDVWWNNNFFYVKIWNHPTERTPIEHCCLEFQVYHITNQVFFNYLGPNQSDRISGQNWPCEVFSGDVTIGFRIKTLKASFYRSFLNLWSEWMALSVGRPRKKKKKTQKDQVGTRNSFTNTTNTTIHWQKLKKLWEDKKTLTAHEEAAGNWCVFFLDTKLRPRHYCQILGWAAELRIFGPMVAASHSW